jgi:ribosomal protein L21E
MVKRIGGFRRKTRHKLSKNVRRKGKISITKFFQKFKAGDKVILNAEPAYQKGMYYPRFHGRSATINKKLGTCYEVSVKDNNKSKNLIVHPVHLKKL